MNVNGRFCDPILAGRKMSNRREFYQVIRGEQIARVLTDMASQTDAPKVKLQLCVKPKTQQWNPRWGGENRQILDISSLFSSKEDPSIYLVGEVEQEKLTL